MDADAERALTSGGDTMLHHHSADATPTHWTLRQLQRVANQVKLSAAATLGYTEDLVLVDTTAGNVAITLPPARGGNEVTLVKIAAANQMTINASGAELINGAANIVSATQWDRYRVKGCPLVGGYILV